MSAAHHSLPAHLQLRFGRYETPAFEYGDIVFCERFGDVRITGITDAGIAWPVIRCPVWRSCWNFVVITRLALLLKDDGPVIFQILHRLPWWRTGKCHVSEVQK